MSLAVRRSRDRVLARLLDVQGIVEQGLQASSQESRHDRTRVHVGLRSVFEADPGGAVGASTWIGAGVLGTGPGSEDPAGDLRGEVVLPRRDAVNDEGGLGDESKERDPDAEFLERFSYRSGFEEFPDFDASARENEVHATVTPSLDHCEVVAVEDHHRRSRPRLHNLRSTTAGPQRSGRPSYGWWWRDQVLI
jgi:hypothetical protein